VAGGKKVGDQWIPYDSKTSGDSNSWGLTESKQRYQSWLLCNQAATVWYENAPYSGSFDGAKAFCAAKGARLPTYDEICPQSVVAGGKKVGDQWIPYDSKTSGDSNSWVQVGSSRECMKHDVWGQPFPLTESKQRYQSWLLCIWDRNDVSKSPTVNDGVLPSDWQWNRFKVVFEA